MDSIAALYIFLHTKDPTLCPSINEFVRLSMRIASSKREILVLNSKVHMTHRNETAFRFVPLPENLTSLGNNQ
jgi:hypothetical protein